MAKKPSTTAALHKAAKAHGDAFSSKEYANDHFTVGARWMQRHLAAKKKKP